MLVASGRGTHDHEDDDGAPGLRSRLECTEAEVETQVSDDTSP